MSRARLPDHDPDWPPETSATVYRVVQESLTNVSRHAPSTCMVTVDVADDPGAIAVEVTNDGPVVAGPRSPAGGYGLLGMQERVEALGGSVHAGPRAGGGWSVRAVLPPSRSRQP